MSEQSSSSSSSSDAPSVGATTAAMLSGVLTAVFKTVFVLDSRQAVTRSAVFMLAFLVVHVAGNLVFFAGQEPFNRYAAMLESMPLIKIIEGYLALCFVIHIVAALYRTNKKKAFRGATSEPLSVLSKLYLLLTGFVILAFVIVHLQHFKFGEQVDYVPPGSDENGETAEVLEDFYTLEMRVLKDPFTAGLYTCAILAIGVHLYEGWTKAVLNMDLEKRFRIPVRNMGHILVIPVTLGFLACIAVAYVRGNAV